MVIVHGDNIPEKAAQHPLLELIHLRTGLLPLCRQTLGSERHRYAFALPNKFWTDPMTVGGKDGHRSGKRDESRE